MNQKTIWLTLWICFNLWLPTYMFAFVLILIFPNIGTAFLGLIMLITGPPFGLIILLNAAIYGWLLSCLAKLLSIGICYFEQSWLRALLLIAILLASLTITFVPIYGSGSVFRSGSMPGKSFWSLLIEGL